MDPGWSIGVLLLALRLGAVLAFTPPVGTASVPAPVRVAWIFALAAALTPATDPSTAAPPPALGPLLAAALSELGLGAAMGLGLNLAFGAVSLGARLLDVQIGFGLGQALDPLTRQPTAVVTSALMQLALVAFFLLDVHLALLRGLQLSVQHVPPGASWSVERSLPLAAHQVAQLFSLGFSMAAPLVVGLLLLELCLGVIARQLPQLNALALSQPVKVLVGLAGLSVWIAGCGPALARLYAAAFSGWEALWR